MHSDERCRELLKEIEALPLGDAALVVLPHHLHTQCGIDCLNAGLHVLMEKPLANTEAECLALMDAAKKNGCVLMTAYCMRFHPILHYSRLHAGVDLTAATGTPIYASGSGTVIFSGVQTGYGNVVKINHGYGYMTVYGHCSKLLVETGQKVNRGDVIALVGSTGLSTSPHLHYEVRINNNPVNPINFYKDGLSEEEYQKLLEASKDQNIYEE